MIDLMTLQELWDLLACWNRYHPQEIPRDRFPNLIALMKEVSDAEPLEKP